MTPWIIVGGGRMGRAFAAVAQREGIDVRSLPGRAEGAPRRPAAPALWILAVTDAALETVCERITPALTAGDVVVHLAGARGLDALSAIRASGAAVGALHPLAAVATLDPPGNLRGAAFLVEGDAAAIAAAHAVAEACGGTLLVAGESVDRDAYHAGAALVASGAVAIAQGAQLLFARAVRPEPAEAARRAAVASLLRSVARNIEALGADGALASPLLRNDTATVERHLRAMAFDGTVRGLYRAVLARVVVPLEAAGAVMPETLRRVRALLAGEDPEGPSPRT